MLLREGHRYVRRYSSAQKWAFRGVELQTGLKGRQKIAQVVRPEQPLVRQASQGKAAEKTEEETLLPLLPTNKTNQRLSVSVSLSPLPWR